MNVIITGSSGFIGSHLTEALLAEGHSVVGIDNFDPFYARSIKENNIKDFINHKRFRLIEKDIRNSNLLKSLRGLKYDVIVHLAAKAGVRPSIQNPIEYQSVNVTGTQNMLEIAYAMKIPKFIFGSSSSVYGINPNVPWPETDKVLQPISPYAATKLSGELLGHVYSHLYGIQFLGLRFFTVYGPRQRPDLAINKFVTRILNNIPIQIYGDGTTKRDYTFVDDIVDGIKSALLYEKSKYEIINLGNNQTVELMDLVSAIEEVIGQKPKIEYIEEMPGDVSITYANISKAKKILGYTPSTSLKYGLSQFYDWYKGHPSKVGQ